MIIKTSRQKSDFYMFTEKNLKQVINTTVPKMHLGSEFVEQEALIPSEKNSCGSLLMLNPVQHLIQ